MANTNTFGIDYTNKKLLILFNGETHSFDLTEGDTGDFWSGFVTKDGREWDINFYQESEIYVPRVSVYPAEWIGDENGSYEIDTNNEFILDLIARTGTAKEYFESSIVTKPLEVGDTIGGRFKVRNIIKSEESSKEVQLIKVLLASILEKINECGINAWNANLEDYVEAVCLEDYYGDVEEDGPTVKYNGWYDDLEKLIESL